MTTTPALAVLPNFPMVSQLESSPPDGNPPENARYDCVPASLAAAIEYYDNGTVSPDALKDAEYGESYANAGTSLKRYVDDASDLARAKYHVTCVPYNNTNTVWLVGRIHTWLRQGYPVIATIPSQWGTAHDMATLAHPPFSTHVICFYGEIAGGLEAMNPWGGFSHPGSDEYWQGRLCEGQIWAVVKETDVSQAQSTNPTPLELSQWHELQADRAQIATLKQQLATVQAQSVKQYQEILANRAQILRQNATIADLQQQLAAAKTDPVAENLLAAVRAAAKGA